MIEQKKIALAESDEAFRMDLLAILADNNMTVIPASSGAETLEIVRNELDTLDLLIIDLDIPGTDIFEIIREVRKLKDASTLPVLALSSSLQEKNVEGMLKNLYVVRFLKKSTPKEEILFWVRTILFPKEMLSRKHPRIIVNMPITFQVGTIKFYGHSFTLSEAGMFIRTQYIPMLNTRVRLSFTLPGSNRAIECGSHVIWLNAYVPGKVESIPFGMGLKFTRIKNADRNAIKEFVLNRIVR